MHCRDDAMIRSATVPHLPDEVAVVGPALPRGAAVLLLVLLLLLLPPGVPVDAAQHQLLVPAVFPKAARQDSRGLELEHPRQASSDSITRCPYT